MAKMKALPAPAGAKKPRGGGALVALEQQLAADAAAAAAKEPVSGGMTIRTDKKKFTYSDTVLPSPLEVIVLAQAYYNAYYDTPYDPEDPQPPACFAVAQEADQLTRHEKAPRSPVGEGTACALCPMNAFGTADVGRGKACNNYRRLAVVMADDPALEGEGDLTWATLSIPPTGLGQWSKYVKGLAKLENRPPHGVVTSFGFDPERNTPCVIAIGYDKLTRPEVIQKVLAARQRVLEENALLSTPDPAPRAPRPDKKVVKGKKPAPSSGRGKRY